MKIHIRNIENSFNLLNFPQFPFFTTRVFCRDPKILILNPKIHPLSTVQPEIKWIDKTINKYSTVPPVLYLP